MAALVVLGLIVAGKASAEPAPARPKVIEALDHLRNLSRPQQDNYATFWEGDKYVQCHALSDQSVSCEAASPTMQLALQSVLTADRKQRLAALGWRPDPSFGVYSQTFPSSVNLEQIADRILAVLSQAYDADLTFLEVQTRWVAHQPCPPRRGPSQNLAGLVDDDPMMASTAVHGCANSAAAASAAAVAPPPAPGGINLLAGARAASDASAANLAAAELAAAELAAEDSAVVVSVAEDPVSVREPRVRRRREPHERRTPHPRARSGHRASRGEGPSRAGGHGGHGK